MERVRHTRYKSVHGEYVAHVHMTKGVELQGELEWERAVLSVIPGVHRLRLAPLMRKALYQVEVSPAYLLLSHQSLFRS